MPKDKKPGMPSSSKKVHIIGEEFTDKDKKIIDAAVQAIVQKVEPILNGIGQMVDSIDKRLAVVEEVKKIFPDKVEVTVKHEYPKVSVPHIVTDAEIEEELFEKYKSIIEDKKKEKEKK